MRMMAIVKRILRQFLRDKRSIAMMFVAPLFVMTLLWFVLDLEDYKPKLAIDNVPEQFMTALEKQDVTLEKMTWSEAKQALENETIDAYLSINHDKMKMVMEGSDPTATSSVQQVIHEAIKHANATIPDGEVQFLHGSADINLFDYVGPILIGFFVFFFTFIIGGVTFLRERTIGTLERLLATPLKRWEIVIGYLIGFGIFVVIQSMIIVAYSIYVLDIYMDGSFIAVLVIALLLAIAALSLGTLLSAYAKNEFQMIQFIPIVIVPQVFFAGIFHIESLPWLEVVGKAMPLYYGGNALSEIMIRGRQLSDILPDITILVGFSTVFILLNILALKRYRKL